MEGRRAFTEQIAQEGLRKEIRELAHRELDAIEGRKKVEQWAPPEVREELEKQMIVKALEEADNHQTKAAGILGIIEIVFGLILMAEYGSLGSGLVMIWVAALWGVIGGVLMVIQAFRQRKA